MRKLFSILLSLVLIVSHMHLAMGTHYCGGEAVETRILLGTGHVGCGMEHPDSQPAVIIAGQQMATACGMEHPDSQPGASGQAPESVDQSPCCENRYQTLQTTEEFVQQSQLITEYNAFPVVILHTDTIPAVYPESLVNFYSYNIPPPSKKDKQVLYQVFLN